MIAPELDIIPASDSTSWRQVLNQAERFDFYHLPAYHRLAEERGEGRGVLLVFRQGDKMAAWPFLLRSLQDVAGLEAVGKGWQDATSVYGYPGPICSSGAREDPLFANRFAQALLTAAKELNLVSLFSRLNPLLENMGLIDGLGTVLGLGETVSIDLSLEAKAQWSAYRKSHRYDIRRARREGVRAYRDQEWSHLDTFECLYSTFMQRVGAADHLFFDIDYLAGLREALGERLQLFVAEHERTVCSAALFVHTGAIIQYHLSASDPQCSRLAPAKLVIDEARLWGSTKGVRFLHLGGGVGAQEDGLFRFKAGFSPMRHRFCIWKHIVLPDVYEQMVEARQSWLTEKGQEPASTSFFPLYRAG